MFKLSGPTTGGLDGGGAGNVGGHTQNNSSIFLAAQWTAPSSGKVDISGDVWMYRNIGRNDTVSIFDNGIALFSDVLIPDYPVANSASPFLLSAAANAPGDLLNISVNAGDQLTLAIRKTPNSPYGDEVGMAYHLKLTPRNSVPEPGTYSLLLSLGIGAAALLRRHRIR